MLESPSPLPQFGISHYACVLGDTQDIDRSWTPSFGKNPLVARRIADIGLMSYRATQGKTPADIVFDCIDRLFEDRTVAPQDVDLIILGHTLASSVSLPPDGIIHTISERYGTKANGFSVNQLQCSTPSFVLNLVGKIMACEAAVSTVLFVTADICIDDETRCGGAGSLFMSDGAVAVVFSRDDLGPRHIASSVLVDSQYYDDEMRDRSARALAQYELTSTAFNITCCSDVLKKSGWSAEDIDWYIPFSGNPKLWRNVCAKMKLPDERLLFPNLQDVGHLFSSDLIHNLMTAVESGVVTTGDKVACATLGDGRTFGCSLFEI